MARVTSFEQQNLHRSTLHPTETECDYAIFEHGGQRYLQISSAGSKERRNPGGGTTQTYQFDLNGARELRASSPRRSRSSTQRDAASTSPNDFPSSTSAGCSRGSRGTRRSTASRSSTSGAGTPRPGRPPTSWTRSARPPGRRPRTATRRSAACRSCAAALAERYRSHYGVQLDPDAEVAVVPGTKTAIVELCLALAEEGQTVVLPDPYYPDYPSGPALAGADIAYVPLDPGTGGRPTSPRRRLTMLRLSTSTSPLTRPPSRCPTAPSRTRSPTREHDRSRRRARLRLRRPGLRRAQAQSFLATPGAKDVGVEMFSMSKSYGMAGWRVGFVVGNAEIVERINLLNDHCRVGIFRPIQEAVHRGADRASGLRRRAARHLPAPARPGDRGARAADLRGHLLHLDEAARGPHRRGPARPSTASRSRPARASGPAARATSASRSPSATRRSSSGSSASPPRSPPVRPRPGARPEPTIRRRRSGPSPPAGRSGR